MAISTRQLSLACHLLRQNGVTISDKNGVFRVDWMLDSLKAGRWVYSLACSAGRIWCEVAFDCWRGYEHSDNNKGISGARSYLREDVNLRTSRQKWTAYWTSDQAEVSGCRDYNVDIVQLINGRSEVVWLRLKRIPRNVTIIPTLAIMQFGIQAVQSCKVYPGF